MVCTLLATSSPSSHEELQEVLLARIREKIDLMDAMVDMDSNTYLHEGCSRIDPELTLLDLTAQIEGYMQLYEKLGTVQEQVQVGGEMT